MTATRGEIVKAAEAPEQQLGLLGTTDPGLFVQRLEEVATVLHKFVSDKGLIQEIETWDRKLGRKVKRPYPKVEAWTVLGTMLGVYPVTRWSRPIRSDGSERVLGWEARVEAVNRDGVVIGGAEAMCMRSESRWAQAEDHAIRSMAQTRATSKALRQPLGFVMAAAGMEATPAEEMPATAPEPTHVAAETTPAEAVSAETLKKLRAGLRKTKDRNWSTENVLKTAQGLWGVQIKKLGDLSEDQATSILSSLTAFLEAVAVKEEEETKEAE